MMSLYRMKTRKLFNNAKNAPKHPIIHYGSAKGARNSIRRLRGKDTAHARQLATRMYYRAKYHKYQTKGMRAAMKVWGKYLKTFKKRGGSSSKAMVIVEPRKHKNLLAVLENFDKNMPKDWDLYFFYGKGLQENAKEVTKTVTGRTVILNELETENLNPDQYNELLKKTDFWNKVDAEIILVFQTDGAYCSKTKFNIDKFLKYDYIGCSYNKKAIGKGVWEENEYYGVGGISLRKKSFMLKCIADKPETPANFAEDVFYSNCVAKSKNRPESGDIIAEFCSQSAYDKDSLFTHKPGTMPPQNINRFLNYCPEGKITRNQVGGSKEFHYFDSGSHYGDCILTLKFFYNILKELVANDIIIHFYYKNEYIKHPDELERYSDKKHILLHDTPPPEGAKNLWMGHPINNYTYFDIEPYYSEKYKQILIDIGLSDKNIDTSLYQKEEYLLKIYDGLNEKFKNNDILFINAVPVSSGFVYNKEKMDALAITLSEKYKIVTTEPVNDKIPSTRRDGLKIQDIGAISTHVKYIIGVHTGPHTACLNFYAKTNVKKWFILHKPNQPNDLIVKYNEISAIMIDNVDEFNKIIDYINSN